MRLVAFSLISSLMVMPVFWAGGAMAEMARPSATPARPAATQPKAAVAATAAKPSASTVKPVLATPQSTTETYGDWILICSSTPAGQICEVDTTLSLRGQAEAVARIAFGQPAKGKPLRLVVQTPANILIPPGVKLDIEPDKKSVSLAYRSCAPGGCFAESDLSPEQDQFFRGRSDPGQLVFTSASGQVIALPVSFRGLEPALDALGHK